MSGALDSITSSLISRALDVSVANHQAIAHNIANASTLGYQPLKLNFEEIMAEMQDVLGTASDAAAAKAALSDISLSFTPGDEGLGVQLDAEMVAMSINTTHYQALLSARSQWTSLMGLAIKGGR
jgi:flagellar basal-body rod protein FlgB